MEKSEIKKKGRKDCRNKGNEKEETAMLCQVRKKAKNNTKTQQIKTFGLVKKIKRREEIIITLLGRNI